MELFKRFTRAVGFAGEMGKTAAVHSVEGLTKTLISLDPANANETQLRLMDEELKKASLTLETKRQELKKEVDEALQAESAYNKYKKATMLLAERSPESSKLDSMITKTKDLKEVAIKEREEADAVQELVDMLDEVIQAKFDQIKQAERALANAERNIEKQKLIAQNAKAKEDLETLKNSTNDFSVALNAMNDEASKLEAQNLSNQRLKDLEKGSDIGNDDEIASLLAEAEGKSNDNSLASRLADL